MSNKDVIRIPGGALLTSRLELQLSRAGDRTRTAEVFAAILNQAISQVEQEDAPAGPLPVVEKLREDIGLAASAAKLTDVEPSFARRLERLEALLNDPLIRERLHLNEDPPATEKKKKPPTRKKAA